jgi:4-diphosphocytidyl-2-C-methyl-D-erythritol kinase
MKILRVCSPAKINLFLHVTGRREDGYHTIQTVFQLLNWGDHMTFELTETAGIELSGDTNDIPAADNLILRAAHVLGQPDRGARIHIQKHIPRGGGLGGGSSNAALTLLALNRLWELGFDQDKLMAIGTPLGADVGVFLLGRSAWAEGVGDTLSPLTLPKRWFVIAQPRCEVSTAEIFRHPELTRHTAPITVQAFFSGAGHNDLQGVVMSRYPEVRRAWDWLQQHSPTARMTGSGACLFAALETEEAARRIAVEAPTGLEVAVAEGLNRLPEMREVT